MYALIPIEVASKP